MKLENINVKDIRSKYPQATIAICYATAHVFKTVTAAKRFFLEGMCGSDGSESERYATIYEKLSIGWTLASDNQDILDEQEETSTRTRDIQLHGNLK